MQEQIEESAYAAQRAVDSGEQVIVGVNRFVMNEEQAVETLRHRPELEREQIERLRTLRAARDNRAVSAALDRLEAAARSGENVLPAMKEAHGAMATIGEVSDRLRRVFGTQDSGAPVTQTGVSL
jgi:methylmalonyl-CoA mutase N-terminal domain/subunit